MIWPIAQEDSAGNTAIWQENSASFPIYLGKPIISAKYGGFFSDRSTPLIKSPRRKAAEENS
jgi:hypothetical protein